MKTLRDALGSEDDRDLPPAVGTFLRGLSLGALVGAAIAGSALLQRRRHRDDAATAVEPAADATPEPVEP
jgi:hypothetical protein